jgi:hypothetical protein
MFTDKVIIINNNIANLYYEDSWISRLNRIEDVLPWIENETSDTSVDGRYFFSGNWRARYRDFLEKVVGLKGAA